MRLFFPFKTLRGQLAFVACLATLPAFFFVAYLASNDRAEALHRAEMESRYVAVSASREHALQVQGAQRLLERLADLYETREHSLNLQNLLPTILSGFPQFANLGVLTPDGTVLFSSVATDEQVNMMAIPSVKQALNTAEVTVGTYQIGLIVKRPILIMTRALRGPSQRADYVLFAALDLNWLNRLAKHAELPLGSALFIVDRNGTILAGSLSDEKTRTKKQQLNGFDRLQRYPDELTLARANDGVARLALAVPLEGINDLWVVVGAPRDDVYAMANQVFFRDLFVLALLTLLAIVSSLAATDFSILKDIRLLASITRRFGHGELSVRAAVPSLKGEIRDLAKAFNDMADTLALQNFDAIQTQEDLRALSHRLQHTREEEAARIAQELHDELGQELSVLRLELERLNNKLKQSDSSLASNVLIERIGELGAQVESSMRSVRRIASELRPSVLDRLGLVAGIEWLLNEFERRTGIATTLISKRVSDNVDSETATALFRITQEALSNIAKHSAATSVAARLSCHHASLNLVIKDNGSGFDPDAKRAIPSLGLLGMHERVNRLGGRFYVKSAPEYGTEIRVWLPVTKTQQETV